MIRAATLVSRIPNVILHYICKTAKGFQEKKKMFFLRIQKKNQQLPQKEN